ncbi:MAG: glycine cleavage system protein H [Desulfobulbus propionicus]|nr:MAG: glycine cleavage system protein H [Desulfobulbus propionicus]
MKEIEELRLPENIRYSRDHEWAQVDGDLIRIGVSDYAQDQLGDIVFVEMPAVGDSFAKGDEIGTLESVKAVSELYTPVGGEVAEVNQALEDSPEKINEDPYANWIIAVKPTSLAEMDELLTAAAYKEMLKE